ncbi:MAG: hypothetical protein O3B13_09430 [Planctomycetota bacterium]|nr:hypothetical protein [Planctomycetota bacterium]
MEKKAKAEAKRARRGQPKDETDVNENVVPPGLFGDDLYDDPGTNSLKS